MDILFLFLYIVAFFLVALPLWNYIQRRRGNTMRIEDIVRDPVDGTCCGQHATCEKDSLISCFEEKPDYFDDEELDAYIGRESEAYIESEVELFREVFYSMYDQDKARWIRSLQMRNVAIPDQLKDEILLVINDIRAAKTA